MITSLLPRPLISTPSSCSRQAALYAAFALAAALSLGLVAGAWLAWPAALKLSAVLLLLLTTAGFALVFALSAGLKVGSDGCANLEAQVVQRVDAPDARRVLRYYLYNEGPDGNSAPAGAAADVLRDVLGVDAGDALARVAAARAAVLARVNDTYAVRPTLGAEVEGAVALSYAVEAGVEGLLGMLAYEPVHAGRKRRAPAAGLGGPPTGCPRRCMPVQPEHPARLPAVCFLSALPPSPLRSVPFGEVVRLLQRARRGGRRVDGRHRGRVLRMGAVPSRSRAHCVIRPPALQRVSALWTAARLPRSCHTRCILCYPPSTERVCALRRCCAWYKTDDFGGRETQGRASAKVTTEGAEVAITASSATPRGSLAPPSPDSMEGGGGAGLV